MKVSYDKRNRYRRAGTVLTGVGISVIVFILYLRTLAPTILPYDSPNLLDTAMLQMQVCVLGITHPTGYPTYLTLSHLLTSYLMVPFVGEGSSCAYRANLASALYAAVSVGGVYGCGYVLSRRVVGGVVGALAFGVSTTLWSQAVIAEVYTLNAALVALTLFVLLLWRERRRDHYLLAGAFLVGLCMTNHLTSGLLLPASVLFVALVQRGKLVEGRVVLKGVGLFLVGLTPYLYLPIRAAMDPPFKANNPTNFERFWYVVSGGNLRGGFFSYGLGELPWRLEFYMGYLLENIHWALVVVGVVGLVALVLWDRAVAALLGFLFLGWLFHAIENDIADVQLYFIPTYLVVCLWAAVGVGVVLEETEDLLGRVSSARVPKRAVVGAVSVGFVLLTVVGVGKTYTKNDKSEDYRGQKIIEDVAKNAEPHATILHHRSNLWYMVLVEKRRRDLTLVDPFHHNRDISYANLVWPDDDIDLQTMNRRYGTDDRTGVTAAKKAAKNGPVYIIDQDDVNRSGLYKAGFRTVHVEGVLYELIAPRGDTQTGEGATS